MTALRERERERLRTLGACTHTPRNTRGRTWTSRVGDELRLGRERVLASILRKKEKQKSRQGLQMACKLRFQVHPRHSSRATFPPTHLMKMTNLQKCSLRLERPRELPWSQLDLPTQVEAMRHHVCVCVASVALQCCSCYQMRTLPPCFQAAVFVDADALKRQLKQNLSTSSCSISRLLEHGAEARSAILF